MATYTKVYNNPYPDGWKDGKDGNTPVTASILNNQTETLESIEQYLEDNPITQGGGSGETGTTDYNDLTNKPSINGTELSGDITLDIPEKISDLENDSEFLTDIKEQPYSDLSGKPTINGVEVVGDLTSEDLNLSGGGTTDYEELDNLPSIENVELKGNVTLAELGTKKQIRISWADYQALSTEEKNDLSVVYYVYDYPGNVILASNVVYDNATSGVEATEVQGAIDEVNKKTQNLIAVSLWNTQDSSAQFSAQTISLSDDISNYSYYEITYARGNSSSTNRNIKYSTGKITSSSRTRLQISERYNYFRQISIPSGTSLEISDCSYFENYGTETTVVNNDWIIPISVLGYKSK